MIAHRLKTTVEFHETSIPISVPFDAVLRFYDLQNEDIEEQDKIDIALEMFISERWMQWVRRLAPAERDELLKLIYANFILIESKKASSDDRLCNFAQDATFIYSSFLMDYGIDLIDKQGVLDWRKFIALFHGLSERTKIREVMSIRARKIPAPTKYNADEIQALAELKAYYALTLSEEEKKANFQNGLDRLGANLEGMARNGKGKS